MASSGLWASTPVGLPCEIRGREGVQAPALGWRLLGATWPLLSGSRIQLHTGLRGKRCLQIYMRDLGTGA